MRDIQKQIEQIAKEQCVIHQLEFWGLETSLGGKKGVVRLYVDKRGGVTIDQLAKLSRDLETVLDVEDVIPGSYILEVSSPGLERKFFEPGQLANFLGQEVDVKLKQTIDKVKRVKGVLVEVKGHIFSLQTAKDRLDIDFFTTEWVRLVAKF